MRDEPPAPTAREAAARALARQAWRWPDVEPDTPRADHLDPRDAALAHAIYHAAISRWLSLAHLLHAALGKPLSALQPELQGVLIAGAAQLWLLDRIPTHAAIDESVDLAKQMVRLGAAGICNVALRRLAEMRDPATDPTTGSTLPLRPPEIPPTDAFPVQSARARRMLGVAWSTDPLERLAQATGHHHDQIVQWADRLATATEPGPAVAARLAWHSLADAPTILNTTFAAAPLPQSLTPHAHPGHHVFTGAHAELVDLLAARGDLWVQDPSSSLAIEQARHLRPRLIVDACAGQGTKTRQLAHTFPDARIIASDPDHGRSQRLRDLLAAHPWGKRVEVIPPRDLILRIAGQADLILLDVPCSNSGVLARRAEARLRFGRAQTQRLNDLQRQIVADAIPLLRTSPRGKILYATCSIDRDENQEIVNWAIRWHRFRIEHEVFRLPQGLPGDPPSDYADGAYSALLG